MNVIVVGATGMIGQGVLRECLHDPAVRHVLAIGRSATGVTSVRLHERILSDITNLDSLAAELVEYDACFFCVGVTSVGMKERDYTRVTFDLTLAFASALARIAPAMTFVYVSGAGTDRTEKGRAMWARVKGRTENALLALPFAHAYMFRPGLIQPRHGIRSRTAWYNVVYFLMRPVLGLMRAVVPALVTSTDTIGRAMLHVAREGYPVRILEMRDIARAGSDR